MLLDFLRELEEQRRKEETDQILGTDARLSEHYSLKCKGKRGKIVLCLLKTNECLKRQNDESYIRDDARGALSSLLLARARAVSHVEQDGA